MVIERTGQGNLTHPHSITSFESQGMFPVSAVVMQTKFDTTAREGVKVRLNVAAG